MEQRDELERLQRAFNSLKTKDIPIVKVGVDFTDALLPLAVEQCSVVNDPTHTSAGKALAAIGVLAWFCTKIRPSVSNKFPLYLKALYESDNEVVDEVAIKAWHAATKGNLFPLMITSSNGRLNSIFTDILYFIFYILYFIFISPPVTCSRSVFSISLFISIRVEIKFLSIIVLREMFDS